MIALDKQPGVRPVGFWETSHRLFANIVLKVTGPEEAKLDQDGRMCAGLKKGIYDTIHGFQALWDKKSSMDEWEVFARRHKYRVQQD